MDSGCTAHRGTARNRSRRPSARAWPRYSSSGITSRTRSRPSSRRQRGAPLCGELSAVSRRSPRSTSRSGSSIASSSGSLLRARIQPGPNRRSISSAERVDGFESDQRPTAGELDDRCHVRLGSARSPCLFCVRPVTVLTIVPACAWWTEAACFACSYTDMTIGKVVAVQPVGHAAAYGFVCPRTPDAFTRDWPEQIRGGQQRPADTRIQRALPRIGAAACVRRSVMAT